MSPAAADFYVRRGDRGDGGVADRRVGRSRIGSVVSRHLLYGLFGFCLMIVGDMVKPALGISLIKLGELMTDRAEVKPPGMDGVETANSGGTEEDELRVANEAACQYRMFR